MQDLWAPRVLLPSVPQTQEAQGVKAGVQHAPGMLLSPGLRLLAGLKHGLGG